MRRRVIYSRDILGTIAAIGTVLLVVSTVALVSIVGMFAFGIITIPEDPPEVDVVYNQLNDRWSVHISDVSEEFDLRDYRLIARRADGSFVQYDPDGDAIPDSILVADLSDLVSGSGGGPQGAPLVFLDVDSDGKVSSGDILIAHSVYVPDHSLLMDGTRGYKTVGGDPHGIPLDSDLVIVATKDFLIASGLQPGDEVNLDILHGGTVEATRSGHASAAGVFMAEVHMEPTWHLGNHKAFFTIRPGEVDEWTHEYLFKTLTPDPLTPTEEEQYDELKHPLETGCTISLVHKPSNTIILEFRL